MEPSRWPQPPPEPERRLTRSRSERLLGGVAGGIAATYGLEPVLVRAGFVLVGVLTGGAAVVAYVLGWILIPDEEPGSAPAERRPVDVAQVVGLALVALGASVFFRRFVDGWWLPGFVWPLLLVAAGVALLLLRSGERTGGGAPAARPEPGGQAQAGYPPPSPSAPWAPPPTPGATGGATAPGAPVTAGHAESADAMAAGWPSAPPRPALHREPPSPLTRTTLSLLLLLGGIAALLDAADVLDVDAVAVMAIGLGVVGLALVVAAWFGRARALVPIGVVLTVVTGLAVATDVPWRGGIGDREYRPATAEDLRDTYRLAIGDLVLDLRTLDLPAGTTEIDVSVAIGQLTVLLPPGVVAEVDGRASIGEVDLWGETSDGIGADVTRRTRDGDGDPALTVRARVGIGNLEVERSRTLRRSG